MKPLHIIPYFYLFIAALFIYDIITKLIASNYDIWLSLGASAFAIFMFFFRRKYAKRMENHYQGKK
ncbi:hypothetical protein HX017_16530 [Myroides marinus]|jgi:positive regulator of sigma E activity|uniref:Uncharacterized protein n=1 Tax=Myroides marinus TaxID=703342 RepID=A0A161S257_9FLAO|nr:hypothetical protein [Myroides marinus]MDR0229349.1 hypothetical protein [Flavobacteriaceae bacterium]KUF42014.1 hypothetical protein AS361_13320 [Myroides marinus]KZE78329.1 hypothetical protein AV926_12825 [Myroides marinus]MDM1348609.1 hypothetical protein [Myroides marinus]MDM1352249.1 hypothetical protein [Myroides marinus]